MASSATASNTVLESLPNRPPTPPREPNLVARRSVLARSPFDPRLQLSTPPNPSSPLSTPATNSESASQRIRKRVEWSAHTEYKDPPEYRDSSKPYRASPLSVSRSASRPVKGILKATASLNPLASSLNGGLDGLSNQANIAEMLESTIKQLAGSDRDSRLDAYMMLARALKASNNLPDRVALQDKMGLFMQFIQRDIKSKTENGSADSSLVNHALTLLTTFLHFQAIASTLTSDFGVFIIDHCIRCFEDPAVPKDLVRHLMQVIAFQSFSPKIMTLDRVGRLVNSLQKIEDRLTGKSIVMGRIQIYKRLIKQSRGYMAMHTDWITDMFTDMLSSIRDIRAQAISLGMDAGFTLRNEKAVMRKATEIFQTLEGDHTYIELYLKKLDGMMKDKESSAAVPQILSAITLFLRCPLDRWQHFNSWLRLAQSAFNAPDSQTKQEANYAWNRYVYLSLIDSKGTTPKGLSLLAQPLSSQLRRKVNVKQAEEGMKLRRTVFGGICNLYYYAFRPSPDNTSADAAWDLMLQPVMAQLINLNEKSDGHSDSLTQASRILTGLLDVTTPRGWREDRIRDMPLVTPEDLPSIDAKWTRRNCDKVFQLVGPILEKKFTDLANKESLAYRLWQALTGSIAAASAKDIKVSEDTARFFASAFALLYKMWSDGCTDGEEALKSKFLPSIKNYVHVLVKSLGLLPFTEKRLSMTMTNTFEPATPSHRPERADKPSGIVQAPVYHLFSILCSVPPGAADDEDLCGLFQSVFEPFFNERSNKIRAELTREMLRLLPQDALTPYGPWVLAANNMRFALEQMITSSNPSSSERLLGPEYREIVTVLERGLLSHPKLPSRYWISLFDLLSNHIVQECGDAGRAIGLIEPISKTVAENFFTSSGRPNKLALTVATMLFKIAKLPRDRQAVEVARRRLWGAPPATTRASSFDPFDNLYKLHDQSMKFIYNNLEMFDDETDTASYFDAIHEFMVAYSPETSIKMLLKLQDGLCPWIQDEKAQLKLSDESPVGIALRTIWDTVGRQLISLGSLGNKDFNQIEALISAGFKSKHRYIVSKMAETWNEIYKDEESLECSDSLKSIIAALRPRVDVSFPGLEESSGEFGAQAQSFIESQDDLSFIALSSTKSSRNESEPPAPPGVSLLKSSIKGPMTRKRRRDATPDVAEIKSKSRRRTTTPRLRHDNSQIQFAPIVSSPLVEESQHLTERQKEVRQRQQENAGIYAGIRSSPRTRSKAAEEEKVKEETDVSKPRNKESTPEQTASYDEFISSTPTPRRGQALQMEDYADLPSSPPEPRRNPLLTEIQTRSRARSSLDSWQFSSPPGTPPTNQRAEDRLPRVTSTGRASRRSRRKRAKSKSPAETEEVIPSSFAEEVAPVIIEDAAPAVAEEVEETIEEAGEAALDVPSTPRHRAPPDNKVQDTPKSVDDEFVDARSSPEIPPEQPPAEATGAADNLKHDSSFELSEVDESGMMRLVVELEARNRELSFGNASPQKVDGPTTGCITVQAESPEKERQMRTRGMKRSPSPIIPSTPVQPEEESQSQSQSQSQTKSQSKKRKRAAMHAERRSKRRRSGAAPEQDQVEETQETQETPAAAETDSPATKTRRSSRRTAGNKSKKEETESQGSGVEEALKLPTKQAASTDRAEGDTDEELMSQLVTESNAASQSQSHEDVDLAASQEADALCTEKAEAGEGKTSSILDTLRGGLDQLREAALSRDDVYRLEDMLMDMKRELFEAERRGRQ